MTRRKRRADYKTLIYKDLINNTDELIAPGTLCVELRKPINTFRPRKKSERGKPMGVIIQPSLPGEKAKFVVRGEVEIRCTEPITIGGKHELRKPRD